MSGLRRGAHLVRRAVVPTACFGTGYVCCWTQGRDETAPQLLACSAMVSWAGFARGLRHLRHSLPEGAEWPREQLAKAESIELRTLARAVDFCQSQDLTSMLFWQIILRRVSNYAHEEGRESLGVQGLAPVPENIEDEESADSAVQIQPRGSGVHELVGLLEASAAAVASSGCDRELLGPLVNSLAAVVRDDSSAWQQDLGSVAILQMTEMALVASSWLAESMRTTVPYRREPDPSMPPASASLGLSVEDHEEIAQELTAVWQALAQPDAAPAARSTAKGSKSQPQASELLQSVEARFASLQAVPPPPPKSASRPLQDALPSKLAGRLREAMTAGPAKRAPAVPAPTSTVEKDQEARSDLLSVAGKFLGCTAWIVLLGGAAVAVSKDGLGLFSFHIVPEGLRPHWQAFLHQRAIRVEELFANHDPSDDIAQGDSGGDIGGSPAPRYMDSPIGGGNGGPWGAQSTYIQGVSER